MSECDCARKSEFGIRRKEDEQSLDSVYVFCGIKGVLEDFLKRSTYNFTNNWQFLLFWLAGTHKKKSLMRGARNCGSKDGFTEKDQYELELL